MRRVGLGAASLSAHAPMSFDNRQRPLEPGPPGNPRWAEIARAEQMSVEEAFVSATFEIAIPALSENANEDPTLVRRVSELTESVSNTMLMRMSTSEKSVGIEEIIAHRIYRVTAVGLDGTRGISSQRTCMSVRGERKIIKRRQFWGQD